MFRTKTEDADTLAVKAEYESKLLAFQRAVFANKHDKEKLILVLEKHEEERRIFTGEFFGGNHRLDPNTLLEYVAVLRSTRGLPISYVLDVISNPGFIQICFEDKADINPELLFNAIHSLRYERPALRWIVKICDSSHIPMLQKLADELSTTTSGRRSVVAVTERIKQLSTASIQHEALSVVDEDPRKKQYTGEIISEQMLEPAVPFYDAAAAAHDQAYEPEAYAEISDQVGNNQASEPTSPIIIPAISPVQNNLQLAVTEAFFKDHINFLMNQAFQQGAAFGARQTIKNVTAVLDQPLPSLPPSVLAPTVQLAQNVSAALTQPLPNAPQIALNQATFFHFQIQHPAGNAQTPEHLSGSNPASSSNWSSSSIQHRHQS